MLDIKLVRSDPDLVRRSLERRGGSTSSLDEFLAVEAERRRIVTDVETMRAERKKASDEIAVVKKAGGDAGQAIAAMRELGDRIKEGEAGLAVVEGAAQGHAPRDPQHPARRRARRRRGGLGRAARGRRAVPPSPSRSRTTSTSVSPST